MQELEQLKELILHDEQQAIKQIHEELSQLNHRVSDPQKVFDSIVPHFSQLLSHASKNELYSFKASVIDATTELLDDEHDGSFEPIIEKLSPLIYDELRRYIKDHKENVTDLLYPVIGSMISKYVSQMLQDMMNDVNEKIQSGLSVQNIKRKIVAKIKGVSESELLLYEAIPVHVKTVLLIHKQMGAVIAHRVDSNSSINEPEMVASMLTALTDFINSWIDKQESFNEVNEINYGTSKIYLEASGHSYVAVLIEGQVTQEFVNTTNTVFKNILEKFSSEIQEFDGDLSTLPNDDIELLFNPLFELNNLHIEEKKPLKKWPLVLLASILASIFSYFYYINYEKDTFKQMVLERIHTNEHLALYNIDASWNGDTLVIDGKLSSIKLKELVLDVVITKKFKYELENNILVVLPLIDYDRSKAMIRKQLALLNSDLHTDLSFKIEDGLVTVFGQSSSQKKLSMAINLIKEIDIIKGVIIDVTIFRPEVDDVLYFSKNSSALQQSNIQKIEQLAFWLKKHSKSRVGLVGYASLSTNIRRNAKLAKSRAQSVKEALLLLNIDEEQIDLKWTPYPPLFSDNNSSNARCVKIYWYNTAE